jgi:hypothetical protein
VQPFSANALRCIAALACGVSLTLTLRFCLGLRTGDDLPATALAGALATCWEAAKWTFVSAGASQLRRGYPSQIAAGAGLCLLSLALVIGSVGASLSYLQQHAGELREQTLASSRTFQDLEAGLRGIDVELATLRATASHDAESGYRARALGTLAAARQLAERRKAIAAQRNAAATGGVHSASASVLQPIADAIGIDAARMQLLVHLAIALLLEAIGAAALLLLRLTAPAADRAVAIKPRRSSPPHLGHSLAQLHPDASASDPAVVLQPDAAASGWPATAHPDAGAPDRAVVVQSDADAYARCRELITGGAITPSYRAVQAAVQVGQNRARRYLLALCDQGVLAKRHGRFYLRPCN